LATELALIDTIDTAKELARDNMDISEAMSKVKPEVSKNLI